MCAQNWHIYFYSSFILNSKKKKDKGQWTDMWTSKCWTTVQCLLFGQKKEFSTDMCYNGDEPWKYTKWKNLVIKDHIVYDTVFIWNILNRQIHRDRITGLVSAQGSGGWRYVSTNGYGVFMGVIKTF